MPDLNTVSTNKPEQQKKLARQRREILSLAPEKALDAVVNHPLPVTLVQSFAEEDLYLLVNTIGVDDALPLLALASNKQWDYFLDIELWKGDRMDFNAVTHWLERLLRADPDRFTHWITSEKSTLIDYYLNGNIDIFVREHDQEPSDLGDDLFTEDNVYFIGLKHFAAQTDSQKEILEQRDLLVRELLNRMAVYHYQDYVNMLTASIAVLPAETEEELYRLRNLRLAEKGFLPHEEAVGIYQPLTAAAFFNRPRKPAPDVGGRLLETYPWPADKTRASGGADLFARTLALFRDETALVPLQAEFAGLCNQVIAADQLLVKDKTLLDKIVSKVSGYISIGLDEVSAAAPDSADYYRAAIVRDHYLSDLFRVGYGCALSLKWKADRWVKTSWFAARGLALSFWGETGMGRLGGLLLKHPLYFDNYATIHALYREFSDRADIEQTEQTLNDIIAFDDLLGLLVPELASPFAPGSPTHYSLILTLWANHHLAMTATTNHPIPLTTAQFKRFFNELWDNKKPPRRITGAMKTLFLSWLADRARLEPRHITERMGPALDTLFASLEAELGCVEEKSLDPRFIPFFIFTTT